MGYFREARREGGKEGRREGGKEGEREGRREGGKEGEREGGKREARLERTEGCKTCADVCSQSLPYSLLTSSALRPL